MTTLIVIGSIVAYLAAAAATFRYMTRAYLNAAVEQELEEWRERSARGGGYGRWAQEQMEKPVEIPDGIQEDAIVFGVLAGLLWPGFWLLWVPGAYAIDALKPNVDDLPALRAHQREISERAELEALRTVAKQQGWDWAVDGSARDEKGKGSAR